jgi:superfamily II DNA helicase RecQ
MFHSKTRENVKETILQSFLKEDGGVLFFTIAFGMGIDVKGVTRFVHIGPSSESEDYLQESGEGRKNRI